MPRPKSPHLLIAVVIAVVVLAVAAFFLSDKSGRGVDRRVVSIAKDRAVSIVTRPLGRKLCERQCAAIHRGYIYRAEQGLEGARGPQFEPEFCSCV